MAAAPFDVVALVTSAGGLPALNQVLMPLPRDFGAALVIVQHLGGSGSSLVDILRRRCPLPVQWIADHDAQANDSGRHPQPPADAALQRLIAQTLASSIGGTSIGEEGQAESADAER